MKRSGQFQRRPVPVGEDGRIVWSSFRPRGTRLAVVRADAAPVHPIRQQRKSRASTGFSDAVKRKTRERAGRGDPFDAACEACGRWLGRQGGEIQHRVARGSGGCTDAVINGITNAVLLCGSGALRTGCHGACEDREPRMSRGGFWIEHGTGPGYDPRYVPIRLHGARGGGSDVWLLPDGKYAYQAPEGSAA